MQNLAKLTLITGGARSGKSYLAETMAKKSELPVVYFATMGKVASDGEVVERIEMHVERRSPDWQTIEEPLLLANAIRKLEVSAPKTLCLIDCLSLFVSNLLLSIPYTIESSGVRKELEENILSEVEELLTAMSGREDLVFVVVTNEVGSGIVPDNNLARSYRDLLGVANQKFAERADQVFIAISGLGLQLK
ncbi:bifunctional adenosylcobinamide kinase/adenosylcobinamide-phosphate guanylyltransferase [bacterium]|jgi:adenosyl cobinamide kinase/adenosyl cobinamide phosphate guanylyltransferase|nr:bifunctional adenosylcobinamide kinase/adenosylcobinamide-phosphate guanylyltransferase [bacterium]